MLVRKIETFGNPFVIAVDELEQLTHPAAVSLLAFLVQRGPPNLHLAFACRQIPVGLNVGGAVLQGHAEILDAEDLRFSSAEVARFFDLSLTRRALAEEMRRSAGWPLALRVARNSAERGFESGMTEGLTSDWIESRLFMHLGREERDLVLDLGLFGWIDAALLDEVLEPGAMHRVQTIQVLEGLLERVDSDDNESWRLHDVVREHCARQRCREDPPRFAAIHRRIATALAHRGETVVAMRHAINGSDAPLAGAIFERAGGVRYWTRHGVPQYLEADRLLTEDIVAAAPRLKLARCAALFLSGRLHDAQALYAECDRPAETIDDDDFDRRVDACIVRGAMGLYGGATISADWMRISTRECTRLSRSPRLGAATRGHFEYSVSVLHFLRGEFDSALERLVAARALLSGTHYIDFYGEVLRGQIDFVRGQPQDAESRYRRARRLARRNFMLDPVAVTACEVVRRELALECKASSSASGLRNIRGALVNQSVPFSYFATATNVVIDTALRAGRVEEALSFTDDLLARLRGVGSTLFVRLLTALRITALVVAGRTDDAALSWHREGLPENAADCVDLDVLTLRELEAIAEARIRLLTAGERYDEARDLVHRLYALAVKRSFRKIQMRALALSITLEQHAGQHEASTRNLKVYLGLYADTPYAWPLVREKRSCADLVGKFLDSSGEQRYKQAARSLLSAMHRVQDVASLSFSERERAVLRLLPSNRIKQVAASLDLSVHGVRYHLRKLFAKLEVSNRHELLRRARELRLIPEDS